VQPTNQPILVDGCLRNFRPHVRREKIASLSRLPSLAGCLPSLKKKTSSSRNSRLKYGVAVSAPLNHVLSSSTVLCQGRNKKGIYMHGRATSATSCLSQQILSLFYVKQTALVVRGSALLGQRVPETDKLKR
jgi:hypothetical protein